MTNASLDPQKLTPDAPPSRLTLSVLRALVITPQTPAAASDPSCPTPHDWHHDFCESIHAVHDLRDRVVVRLALYTDKFDVHEGGLLVVRFDSEVLLGFRVPFGAPPAGAWLV